MFMLKIRKDAEAGWIRAFLCECPPEGAEREIGALSLWVARNIPGCWEAWKECQKQIVVCANQAIGLDCYAVERMPPEDKTDG